MKKLLHLRVFSLLVFAIVAISCERTLDTIVPTSPANKSPVADAGPNQVITLPEDSVWLNGDFSRDADGHIISYLWIEITGPSASSIQDANAARTLVKDLKAGEYFFELEVTDNGSLTAKDTVKITVNTATPDICNLSNRPQISVTLIQIGTLSVPRTPCVASAGNKIVFAGGYSSVYGSNTAAVDIYDINTHSWTTAQLSKARAGITAIGFGNKIFFAGGSCSCYEDSVFDNVDIYDVTTNTWTLAHLSEPRSGIATAVVGNKILFAGGTPNWYQGSKKVDIYDISLNSWSTAELSVARIDISAVTVGNKVYFAGGQDFFYDYNRIDIYDNTTNSWSSNTLREIQGVVSGTAIGNDIYWAGVNPAQLGRVEIWNTTNNSVTLDCLSYPRCSPTSFVVNDQIVFFGWNTSNRFDIYNYNTGIWSVGLINQPSYSPAIIAVNNTVYLGGGNNIANNSIDKVCILNW